MRELEQILDLVVDYKIHDNCILINGRPVVTHFLFLIIIYKKGYKRGDFSHQGVIRGF